MYQNTLIFDNAVATLLMCVPLQVYLNASVMSSISDVHMFAIWIIDIFGVLCVLYSLTAPHDSNTNKDIYFN